MRRRDAATESGSSGPLSRRETLWLTAAGLSLIAVCYGLARFAYGLFVPVLRNEFSLDAAVAGAIASGSYASYCVAIVLSTMLTPRFGGRIVAVAAGMIATAGVIMIAAAPDVLVLAVGVIAAGSSTGAASPPLAHAVAHTVRPSVRDRAQTVINAGTGVGVAIAGPVALLTHENWRAAWLVFAVLCAIVTVWVAVVVPSGPAQRSEQGSVAELLPRPLLPTGSGRLTAAAAGDLARRFGITTAWMATMLILGTATALLAAPPSLAWIAAAAFGAAYIALTGLLLIWGTEVYSQTPAAGVGLAFLAIAIGQSAGAPLVGALSEAMSPLAAFTAAALIALAGASIRPARAPHRSTR